MSIVIVAIPSAEDPVWQVSSEKVPHMTLLYLGDSLDQDRLNHVEEFVAHAASTSLRRFWMSVDHRGILGDQNADVLFFKMPGYDTCLQDFRSALLQDTDIFEAFNTTEQFEGWTPHLTLGYPETPANPLPKGEYSILGVFFDRIAIWTGDSTGPEFELRDYSSMEVSMSDILEHHGVKGQKWGVRKEPQGTVTRLKKTATHEPSKDAQFVNELHRLTKTDGTAVLSNQELKALVNRMNLEQQFSQLNPNTQSAGRRFLSSFFKQNGKQQANQIVNKKIQKFVK